jgi:CRP-like cAMP-binding protein
VHESDLRPLFRELELRDELSAGEKQAIAECIGEGALVPARGDIVRAGDRPDRSTLMLSGMSVRYNLTRSGSRQITSIHIAGDFVDLHSFVLKQMDHGVSALSDCRVAYVPHAALTRITQEHPHLARLLWLLTLIDASRHRQWLAAMGALRARARAAHLICEIGARMGLAADGETLKIPLTQVELGDTLALSSVYTNKVLQEMRGMRLIEWVGDAVTILSWDRLRREAQFDPAYLHMRREPR